MTGATPKGAASRIWHQSVNELDHFDVYKRALETHAAEVLGDDAKVVVHGLPAGSYGGASATAVLGNAFAYHRILDRVIDFLHQYAEFRYRWNVKSDQNGELLVAPKLSELSLKPSIDERYTIVDVTNTEAVLETGKGEKLAVKPYVRKWPPGSGGR